MSNTTQTNPAHITLSGIGSVIVDAAAGTLRPRTHVAAMCLGVGYAADTGAQLDTQRARRLTAERMATYSAGAPADGWQWLDHNGHSTY